MQHLQDIFNQMQMAQDEIKSINQIYRDSLTNHPEYQMIKEQLDELKEKKKQIEDTIKAQMGSQYEKMDDLKREIKDQKEMLSDIAITTLMEGKTVEVLDEYQNLYEPKFAVAFKKSGLKKETTPTPASAPAENPVELVDETIA